jgi:hypothetical protein
MPTIPQLPAATQVNSSDLFVVDQVSVTKKATGSLVLAFMNSNIQITESQVTNLTTDLASKLAIAANLSDVASKSTSRINLGLPTLTNGQLWIGETGVDPLAANLTAGTNIAIVNSAGTITISASGVGGFVWSEITGTSQAMSANNGYIANNAAPVVFTLPTTSNVGDELAVVGKGAGLWKITQAAGQIIHFGNSPTTLGATGSLTSTNQFDSIYFVCTVANTTWTVLGGAQGNITVA